MFESALENIIKNDATIATYITVYPAGSSIPAVFSELAPEKAILPYIVFRISQSSDENAAVTPFTIFIDYFDYNKSAVNSRIAVNQLINILDGVALEHDRFNKIRIFFYAGSPVQEEDPRNIHYNLQFTARGGRKSYIDNNY